MNKSLDAYDKKNPPIDQLNVMGINVAVWEHDAQEPGKKFRQITIKKNYKDASGELKETQSLSIHDIPILVQQLQNIYSKEIRKEYGGND